MIEVPMLDDLREDLVSEKAAMMNWIEGYFDGSIAVVDCLIAAETGEPVELGDPEPEDDGPEEPDANEPHTDEEDEDDAYLYEEDEYAPGDLPGFEDEEDQIWTP